MNAVDSLPPREGARYVVLKKKKRTNRSTLIHYARICSVYLFIAYGFSFPLSRARARFASLHLCRIAVVTAKYYCRTSQKALSYRGIICPVESSILSDVSLDERKEISHIAEWK